MEDRLELACCACHGDVLAAKSLLNLIDYSLSKPSKIEGLKMDLTEKDCSWLKEGKCWYYFPDSKVECEGKCNNFRDRLE